MWKRLLVVLIALFIYQAETNARPRTLDIYFIDVEGGAATLIVTPSGESILVDSGFPEDRDASRILAVARMAGLRQIDHYITTHWHRDHVGGIPLVARMMPIKNFYDHGLPAALAVDVTPGLLERYRQISENKSVTLKPGDEIPFRSSKTVMPVSVRVMAANAFVVGEQAGSPQIKPCGADFKPIPADITDNANSIGFVLSFGDFQFFDGGDLTWNVENKLVCPGNLIGAVDVFQVNHHGAANSNNPALVRALNPQVAVIDNGPRKGAEAATYATLMSLPDLKAVYQLHRNVSTTDKDNAPADYIANDEEACAGEFIKLSVKPDGKSYSVSIPAKRIVRHYRTR